MEKKLLGRTGLNVTRIGYGAMELRNTLFRDGRAFTSQDVELILNKVLDCGINFIDTSPDYLASEEYIGRFLSRRRSKYYLASKCGCTDVPGENGYHVHVWTKKNLLENIETSLKRLKTDYLDLWQLHNPTLKEVQDGGLIEVMHDVKRAGKARFIGASIKLPHAEGFIETGAFDTIQVPYSALQSEHGQIIRKAASNNIGTIIRGGVSQGSSLNTREEVVNKWQAWERAGLDDLLAENQSRTQFLISYLLADAAVDTVIIGTITPEHLQSNLDSFRFGPLSAATCSEVRRRLESISN
jgi:aryl-alcohol dehydrogenase-like predicted oxidoreductase